MAPVSATMAARVTTASVNSWLPEGPRPSTSKGFGI
ncbi:Uncharacterised protein [Mycobacteroides abscessus subsp. abscessus]|nr:Uncharacterised protein [Mycobacteroides abscessus subsp. abscessus]